MPATEADVILPSPPQSPVWRRVAKHTLFGTASAVGVVALLRRVLRGRPAILCYHSIVDRPLPPWLSVGGLHLGVDRFREQMAFLAQHYQVVSLEAVLGLDGDHRLPPGAVALTFDDGYANTLKLAAPILARRNFPATVFLPTDYIGYAGLYWWDELAVLLLSGLGRRLSVAEWGELDLTTTAGVRAAIVRGNQLLGAATMPQRQVWLAGLRLATGSRDGATRYWSESLRPATWDECRAAPPNLRFGGHGASHRVLEEIAIADADADLQRCSETLHAQLGRRAIPVLGYPGGGSSPAVQAAVRRAGFRGAVTASPRPADDNLVPRTGDATLLPRVGVSAETTLPTFAGQLAGLRRWLRLPV